MNLADQGKPYQQNETRLCETRQATQPPIRDPEIVKERNVCEREEESVCDMVCKSNQFCS
jgi:hypothetical protein